MPGVTINSKLLTTPYPINDCFWYRMGSYLAWAIYVQDCTFMKYTCSLWKHRPIYIREEKGEMKILYRPWEEREKAIHNKRTCWMESPRWGRCVSLCAGFHQHQWDIHGPGSNPTEILEDPSHYLLWCWMPRPSPSVLTLQLLPQAFFVDPFLS